MSISQQKKNTNLTWRVSPQRWRQAQAWELDVWKTLDRSIFSSPPARILLALRHHGNANAVGDDWNEWWAQQFDNYAVVPGQLDNVIELGCGPYTNVRLISRGRTIQRIYCSDPLACHYAGFKNGWLASAYRNRQVLLDDHPAEELPFANGTFDLTIMINVLDHVRDAQLCLESATRITKAGGLFIFGQDLTDETDPGVALDDVGHPIMLDHCGLDRVLLPVFDVELRKVLSREEGRNPQAHYGTYLFIGKKHG